MLTLVLVQENFAWRQTPNKKQEQQVYLKHNHTHTHTHSLTHSHTHPHNRNTNRHICIQPKRQKTRGGRGTEKRKRQDGKVGVKGTRNDRQEGKEVKGRSKKCRKATCGCCTFFASVNSSPQHSHNNTSPCSASASFFLFGVTTPVGMVN